MTDPLGLISNAGSMPIGPVSPGGVAGPGRAGQATGPDFHDVLRQNIEQVTRLQQDAEVAIEDLMAGRREDAAAVLIAKQKADLAFQTLMQVRNKLVDAYEEIKQMRV